MRGLRNWAPVGSGWGPWVGLREVGWVWSARLQWVDLCLPVETSRRPTQIALTWIYLLGFLNLWTMASPHCILMCMHVTARLAHTTVESSQCPAFCMHAHDACVCVCGHASRLRVCADCIRGIPSPKGLKTSKHVHTIASFSSVVAEPDVVNSRVGMCDI